MAALPTGPYRDACLVKGVLWEKELLGERAQQSSVRLIHSRSLANGSSLGIRAHCACGLRVRSRMEVNGLFSLSISAFNSERRHSNASNKVVEERSAPEEAVAKVEYNNLTSLDSDLGITWHQRQLDDHQSNSDKQLLRYDQHSSASKSIVLLNLLI
ncbi:hypothetical protein MRB53_040964 [Persea americana]|nr:hypothetical protein MRB53_040964 [Persea americana]